MSAASTFIPPPASPSPPPSQNGHVPDAKRAKASEEPAESVAPTTKPVRRKSTPHELRSARIKEAVRRITTNINKKLGAISKDDTTTTVRGVQFQAPVRTCISDLVCSILDAIATETLAVANARKSGGTVNLTCLRAAVARLDASSDFKRAFLQIGGDDNDDENANADASNDSDDDDDAVAAAERD